MAGHTHPFHAVAKLAAANGMNELEIMVAHNGDYVRLFQNDPPLFFKHKNDPSDDIDREEFNDFKRILLSEEDCSNGPDATLALIEMLLVKFSDYQSDRPSRKPNAGRNT